LFVVEPKQSIYETQATLTITTTKRSKKL